MERVLDVSALEPCEPLERSLAAAEELAPGDHLRILHRREPFPLYDLLAARGFAHRTVPGTRTAFEVLVWRRDDEVARAAVERALAR